MSHEPNEEPKLATNVRRKLSEPYSVYGGNAEDNTAAFAGKRSRVALPATLERCKNAIKWRRWSFWTVPKYMNFKDREETDEVMSLPSFFLSCDFNP